MDVELAEIRDFLAQHHPFDELEPSLLNSLPKLLTAKYYRRGTTIVDLGQANHNLHVLRSGAVDVLDAHGSLVERTDPGGSFGVSSLASGLPSLYTLIAHEDSLVLLMPAEVFNHLMATSPPFNQFFLRQQAGRMRSAVESVHVGDTGSAVLRTRVRDMLRKEPITVEPTVSIIDAAKLMTEKRISALLITERAKLVGILTDRDMRSKVVAGGLEPTNPVSAIMTPDPDVSPPDRLAFELLVEMTQRKYHHMPVLEDGRLLGMVTAGDLMRLEQANPSYLVGEIAAQTDLAGLIKSSKRIGHVLESAVAQDATADDIGRVLTAVADALTRKLINFAEAELGDPPARYCWVALGSQARLETGLQSDQDSAILIADGVDPAKLAWFGELAERVVSGLEQCGYPRCDGDMMASNPQWRVPLRQWMAYFVKWMNEPQPDALLYAQTFFDMRPVYGDGELYNTLHSGVVRRAPHATRFLAYLAKQAQRFEPPIGFFKDFVLSNSGQQANTVDLKMGGIAPIVQMARIFSLTKGGAQLNTHDRLRGAAASRALSEENAADLADAFEFISYVRLRHQVRQVKQGLQPDSNVAPASLSSFERRHLKEAFGIIRSMQKALAFTYRTDITS